MAARLIYAFAVTIPAGTPQSAPVTVDCMFDPAAVSEVDITIPPGPSGLVGFQLWVLGGQVIPSNQGGWIVGDNRVIPWQVEGQPDSGAWQVVGYNTDIYDHTLYLEFQVTPAGSIPATTTPAVSDQATLDALAITAG